MDVIFYWVGLLVSCFSIGYSVFGILWWLAVRTLANAGNLMEFAKFSVMLSRSNDGKSDD